MLVTRLLARLIGFGVVDQSIQVLDGQALQWPIMVKGGWPGRVDVTATGCLTSTTEDGTVVIASADDHERDGDPTHSPRIATDSACSIR